ncbi:MAG TPA: hypothetical protein VHC22_32720 [Pirellulales bacterium]|nr:hypothetical protein [Pirellulales bacterium]
MARQSKQAGKVEVVETARGRAAKEKQQVAVYVREVRDWARQLREMADTFEGHAKDLETLGADHVTIFVKNFTNPLAMQKDWLEGTFLPAVMRVARDAAATVKLQITPREKK